MAKHFFLIEGSAHKSTFRWLLLSL